MYKIKFANGTEWVHEEAVETSEFYDGTTRRTLTVRLAPDKGVALDAVNDVLSNSANTDSVTLSNYGDDGALIGQCVYDHYQIKIEVAQRPTVVGSDEITGEETKADRISFRLGRLTPIEIKLAALGL